MTVTDIPIPFARHLGIEVLEVSAQRGLVAIAERPELRNSSGTVHGGVLMTLLDYVMSMALRGHYGVAAPVITIDMSVSFMKSSSGRLLAEGRVLNAGRSTSFCEGEVRSESGELLAKAIGTFRLVLPKPPA
jgi:uncharacterized protein (TIGR00369 family)